LREDIGLGPLPVELSLTAVKGRKRADKYKSTGARKKPTRYKNVEKKRPSSKH
jgi:hypothetical protein